MLLFQSETGNGGDATPSTNLTIGIGSSTGLESSTDTGPSTSYSSLYSSSAYNFSSSLIKSETGMLD